MKEGIIIAVANNKGGVGKSSISLNLAHSLSCRKKNLALSGMSGITSGVPKGQTIRKPATSTRSNHSRRTAWYTVVCSNLSSRTRRSFCPLRQTSSSRSKGGLGSNGTEGVRPPALLQRNDKGGIKMKAGRNKPCPCCFR